MADRSMVRVLRARDPFHGRVVVARLGSEGIVAQLRGADGPYPTGLVEVLVRSDDLEAAQELLLADEVESAFTDDEGPGGSRRPGPPRWAVVCAAAVLVLYALSHLVSSR